MKATEAAALLTIAAAYDNRKPDADQAKAWAMALDGLRFEDCRAVVVQHYQTTREWMMPVDVINGVKRIRTKRIADYGPIPAPDHLDPNSPTFDQDYAAYMSAMNRAIGDGEMPARPEPQAIVRRDIRELGQARAVDSALATRPLREAHADAKRALQEADAERKRQQEQRQAAREAARAADRAARHATKAAAVAPTKEDA